MDYILQRCRDEQFRFNRDVVLAVHFMITQYDLKANPGISDWDGLVFATPIPASSFMRGSIATSSATA